MNAPHIVPRISRRGELLGTENAFVVLAEVNDLSVRFVTREATVHAVNGVSFSVMPGEVSISRNE